MNIKKVYSTYKDSIFNRLSRKPWGIKYSDNTLNLLYWTHSNLKTASPVITDVMAGDTLSDDEKTQLADMIEVMFMDNWDYLYKALLADYNPVYNYSMKEDETKDVDGTRNGSNSYTNTLDNKVITDRNTSGETVSNGSDTSNSTSTAEGETHNNVYAYDSEEAVKDSDQSTLNKDSDSSSSNSNSTTTDKGSEDTTETQASKGTETGTDSQTTTEDTTRHLTREGNIGVTTSQQMIESEIKLRETKYWELVFRDIDSLLCLSIWD